MRILDPQSTASKTTLGISTLWQMAATGQFPQPVPLTASRRGWLESEVDAWIAERAAARGTVAKPAIAPGRARFWQEVREGRRPHPRTAGRLRREVEQATKDAA